VNKRESKAPEITQMLREWSDGKQEALDNLLPLVYDELHRQASRFLRKERQGHTLQTTALINEAYLKLIDQQNVNWESLRISLLSPRKRCGEFWLITRARRIEKNAAAMI
jgi:hypothetical protein